MHAVLVSIKRTSTGTMSTPQAILTQMDVKKKASQKDTDYFYFPIESNYPDRKKWEKKVGALLHCAQGL